MLPEPSVVGGLRGSNDRGTLSTPQTAGAQLPQNVAPPRSGERVFISTHERYRMTLWVDWEKVQYSSTGRRMPERRDIQFIGGVYRTADPREIEAIEKSSVYGSTILDLERVKTQAEDARLNAALSAADDPQIAEALKVKLGVKEHAMPPKDGGKKGSATGE